MENTNWVGVDTHKDTLACYRGNSFQEFKTTPQGFEKALEWTGDANWAIEGAYCFGKPFANYCAVAPIDNSSGKSAKHTTNRRGNRKLNSVFFRISMCQSIHDERGKIYYHKKISEGKTPSQARKCLSRQLVNSIFKILKNV